MEVEEVHLEVVEVEEEVVVEAVLLMLAHWKMSMEVMVHFL